MAWSRSRLTSGEKGRGTFRSTSWSMRSWWRDAAVESSRTCVLPQRLAEDRDRVQVDLVVGRGDHAHPGVRDDLGLRQVADQPGVHAEGEVGPVGQVPAPGGDDGGGHAGRRQLAGQAEGPGLRADQQQAVGAGPGHLEQAGRRLRSQPVDDGEHDDHREGDRHEDRAGLADLVQAQRVEGCRRRRDDAARGHAGEERPLAGREQLGAERAEEHDERADHEHQERDQDQGGGEVVEDRSGLDPGGQDDEERTDQQRDDGVAEDAQVPDADQPLVGEDHPHRGRGEQPGLRADRLGRDVGGHDEHDGDGHLELGGNEPAAQGEDQQRGRDRTGRHAGQRHDDELAPQVAQRQLVDEERAEAEQAQRRPEGVDDDPLPREDRRHRADRPGQPQQRDHDRRPGHDEDGTEQHRDPHRLVEQQVDGARRQRPGDDDAHRHEGHDRAAGGGAQLAEAQLQPPDEQQDADGQRHHREQRRPEDPVRLHDVQHRADEQATGQEQDDRGELEATGQPLQPDPEHDDDADPEQDVCLHREPTVPRTAGPGRARREYGAGVHRPAGPGPKDSKGKGSMRFARQLVVAAVVGAGLVVAGGGVADAQARQLQWQQGRRPRAVLLHGHQGDQRHHLHRPARRRRRRQGHRDLHHGPGPDGGRADRRPQLHGHQPRPEAVHHRHHPDRRDHRDPRGAPHRVRAARHQGRLHDAG